MILIKFDRLIRRFYTKTFEIDLNLEQIKQITFFEAKFTFYLGPSYHDPRLNMLKITFYLLTNWACLIMFLRTNRSNIRNLSVVVCCNLVYMTWMFIYILMCYTDITINMPNIIVSYGMKVTVEMWKDLMHKKRSIPPLFYSYFGVTLQATIFVNIRL